MKDLRLLTLYKQHYLDSYDNVLDSKITCIGYYDGLDLEKIDEEKIVNKNFPNSIAPITNLWYSTGKKVENLPRGCSNQNIGLMRCIKKQGQEEYTNRYWRTEKVLPFFLVAFLKLRNCRQYNDIGWEIENRIFDGEIIPAEKTCIVLSYTTLDNSDMVLLLKGNDIGTMEETLHEIENREDIMYLHSILGIEEDYLKCCESSKMILEDWQGTKCFVGEPIRRIEIHLATNGEKHVRAEIASELKKWNQEKWEITGLENMTYSYVMGHGNINLMLRETDVRSLLILLLPGGFSTHQNNAYKHGVYNIETSIFIKEDLLNCEGDTKKADKGNRMIQSGWCKNMIDEYSYIFDDESVRGDEGLYACYQALIQTLNALDQYERFALSRDIFDIVFPSLCMFDDKIQKTLKNTNEGDRADRIGLLKEMMRQYLECVNSVIYHTIHTEQVFLMVPGYSGTSFSIPIKLKLFYTWYSYKMTELLNDAGKKHSYIIAPVIETRPRTTMIGVKLDSDGKMIHICLSQRTLFQPRYLMIILAHEIGHYVGRYIRLRETRLNCVLKTLAYYITEAIFPEEYMDDSVSLFHSGLFTDMRKCIKEKLQIKITDIFRERKKREFIARRYYVRDIEGPLIQWCSEMLMEEGSGKEIYDIIHTIPEEILLSIEGDKENYVNNMRNIYEIQKKLERNRKRLSNTGTFKVIVVDLLTVYKEVFSDIVAITVLNCDRDDYRNAFYISEGSNIFPNEGILPIDQEIRQNIMDKVMFQNKQPDGKQSGDINEVFKTGYDTWCDEDDMLRAKLSQFVWVNDLLEKYARACRVKIQERLSDQKYSAVIDEIRQIYELFKDPASEYDQIYEKISICIAEYRKMVRQNT